MKAKAWGSRSVVPVALMVLGLLLIHQVGGSESAWGYSAGSIEPNGWVSVSATCGGSQQSPINIDPSAAVRENFQPMFFGNYDVMPKKTELENTGHTVMYSMDSDRVPYVSDGGLLNKYLFHQMHLHWGKDSSRGSEHLIKSVKYSGEIHLVHFNEKYDNFKDAMKHPDGLAVISILLTTSNIDNIPLRSIVEVLPKINEEKSDTPLVKPFALKDLLPNSTAKFYRYKGSLTTPGCNEVVTWTVLENPISVSEKQMSKFRELSGHQGPLVENFRPPQPLNGRTVYVRSSAAKLSSPLILPLLYFLYAILNVS